MRLSKDQVLQICNVINKHFQDTPCSIYLYGSRVDDNLKGGDIDILLVTNESGFAHFRNKELDILVDLKKEKDIGQRRIDLKAALPIQVQKDPFLKSISTDMIQIGRTGGD